MISIYLSSGRVLSCFLRFTLYLFFKKKCRENPPGGHVPTPKSLRPGDKAAALPLALTPPPPLPSGAGPSKAAETWGPQGIAPAPAPPPLLLQTSLLASFAKLEQGVGVGAGAGAEGAWKAAAAPFIQYVHRPQYHKSSFWMRYC